MSVTVSTGRDDAAGDGLSVVRAVASAVWEGRFDEQSVTVEAGDDTAEDALQRWFLV
jgi:hypothetical protein